MSFTNPGETWEEWDARLAANRKTSIEAEADPLKKQRLIDADSQCVLTSAMVDEQFQKLFGGKP